MLAPWLAWRAGILWATIAGARGTVIRERRGPAACGGTWHRGTKGVETAMVVAGVVLICGTALWLWELARGKIAARLMIVALWLVLLAMSIITGVPWVHVMGAATVMMGLWVYARGGGS